MTATVRESHRRTALLGAVGRIPWGDGAADIDPPRPRAIVLEKSYTTLTGAIVMRIRAPNVPQLISFPPDLPAVPHACIDDSHLSAMLKTSSHYHFRGIYP